MRQFRRGICFPLRFTILGDSRTKDRLCESICTNNAGHSMHRGIRCALLILMSCMALPNGGVIRAADDWPDWRGVNRDGTWEEDGIISELNEDSIEVLWRQPIGSGYTGPTVADRRVFVMDRLREPESVERVHCFDAVLGQKLWTHEYDCPYVGIGYDAGPRASVVIDDNRAYALGAMGHLHCLDVGNGHVLWSHDMNSEFGIQQRDRQTNRMPIWGIAATPLIYNDLVIVHPGAREGRSVVAFDKESGEKVWQSLNDRAQYSSPILVKQAGKDVMVLWTGDSVAGLAPETGEVYWRFPFAPVNMPIGIATPILEGNRLFVTSFYDGALMLDLQQDSPTVERVWQARGRDEQNTEALHSIISTPLFREGHIYGVDSYGELRCLDAETGERIWEDLSAVPKARWSTIHFVTRGEQVWMFTERGDLILADLSTGGFIEQGRVHLIDPTRDQLNRRGGVCWAHPAFAERCIFVRNDEEIICVSLED